MHSKGNKLPFADVASQAPVGYERAIADALRHDVNSGGASAKAIMRWTGASERAVKGWVSGKRGPTGKNLIALMRGSDTVFLAVLRLVRRDPPELTPDLDAVRGYLTKALIALDESGPTGGQQHAE